MKKAISLFLVFSILLLSGNMFASERKGANLIIQKKNGQQVQGELIAMRQNSLLLKEYEKGIDVVVDTEDVGVIKILKKSEAGLGILTGSLLGVIVGYLFGYSQGSASGFIMSMNQAGMIGAAIGGVSGALIGAGVGVAVGTDKTIQFGGKSDSEIQEILEKLRKQARIKNAQ